MSNRSGCGVGTVREHCRHTTGAVAFEPASWMPSLTQTSLLLLLSVSGRTNLLCVSRLGATRNIASLYNDQQYTYTSNSASLQWLHQPIGSQNMGY